jgi:hypothetical protein
LKKQFEKQALSFLDGQGVFNQEPSLLGVKDLWTSNGFAFFEK